MKHHTLFLATRLHCYHCDADFPTWASSCCPNEGRLKPKWHDTTYRNADGEDVPFDDEGDVKWWLYEGRLDLSWSDEAAAWGRDRHPADRLKRAAQWHDETPGGRGHMRGPFDTAEEALASERPSDARVLADSIRDAAKRSLAGEGDLSEIVEEEVTLLKIDGIDVSADDFGLAVERLIEASVEASDAR